MRRRLAEAINKVVWVLLALLFVHTLPLGDTAEPPLEMSWCCSPAFKAGGSGASREHEEFGVKLGMAQGHRGCVIGVFIKSPENGGEGGVS